MKDFLSALPQQKNGPEQNNEIIAEASWKVRLFWS